MTDRQPNDQLDRRLEQVIALLQTHVPVNASTFDARVLASVRQYVPARTSEVSIIGSGSNAASRTSSLRTSSWIAAALAAGIAVVAVVHGSREVQPSTPALAIRPAALNATSRATQLVRFRFTGADAARVAVAGSFNGWSTSITPLHRIGDSTWVADVALTAGRHVYQFVINDLRWVSDPTAPRDPGDDFGAANSVVTVAVRGRS